MAITRFVKRGGKIWIRVFPDKPITKKPAETRMGKGKGAPEGWVAVVRPGKIIYEMEGVTGRPGAGSNAAGGHKLSRHDEIRQEIWEGGGMKASKMRDMSKEDLLLEEAELAQAALQAPLPGGYRSARERPEDAGRAPGYRADRDRTERDGRQ